MRFIFVFLVCILILDAGEIPVLRFDNSVTWEEVFASGFRPKHLEGLERNTCVCRDQSFYIQFKEQESKFKLERGSIDFSFSSGDFLQMIWHQGTESITLEEGKIRVEKFRKVFKGYIIQEMTMPKLIDPSGLVDANNDENNIKARVNEYRISYGFDNSFGSKKPIIPHFYITWSFPGMPDVKLKDVGDVVRPPKGYEWYSLDPKVNTPDPKVESDHSLEPELKDQSSKTGLIPREEKRRNLPECQKPTVQNTHWSWWVGLFAILAAVVGWVVKKFICRHKR